MPSKILTPLVIIVVLGLALVVPLLGNAYYIHLFALVFTNVILAASLRDHRGSPIAPRETGRQEPR